MVTKGIKDFIRELKKIEGEIVNINIIDKLYGNQKLKCALRVIDDEGRLGFLICDKPIYIYKDRICNYGIKNGIFYFADDVMTLHIKNTMSS